MPPQPLRFLSPIHKAGRQIGVYLQRAMDEHGLATAEGHLLSYLRSYAPCPISELHRVFGLKKSTLTGILDRLEKRRIVRRQPHPDDRRSLLVQLTPKGRTLAEKTQAPVTELEESIAAAIAPRDVEGFRRVMEAIDHITEVELRTNPPTRIPKEKP